jgi:glycosyltransferase involved in cell wall biosynthesis
MPYYPHGIILEPYRGKWTIKEKMGKIDILRIWSLPSSNKGKFRRILSYLSFSFLASLTALRHPRFDLIIASVPNIGTELAGIVVGRLKRSPVLLELRDLIPDNLTFMGVHQKSLFIRLLRGYYQLVYRWVDWIAVPGLQMVQSLVNRGVSPDRIMYLPHAADSSSMLAGQSNDIRQFYHLEGKFIVVYAGAFGKHHGIPDLLYAAKYLQKRSVDIHMVLVGTGSEWADMEQLHRQLSLENLTLTGPVNPAEVGKYLHIADLFIVSYYADATPDYAKGYFTTKVAEYLMAGRPVIAVEKDVTCGPELERIGAGASVLADNPEQLADMIFRYATDRELSASDGQRARQYALEHLDRRKVVQVFEQQLRYKMECRLKKGDRSQSKA